uniref:Uncharacterized protein n=1 Tax=Monopterus albus TaxID=43700 RepID=A0A3Q3R7V5_MONAL
FQLQVKGQSHQGTWLIVASSISYVTSTDLLVWVPVKYIFNHLYLAKYVTHKKFVSNTELRQPSAAPTQLMALATGGNLGVQCLAHGHFDMWTAGLTSAWLVSAVLFFLICIDVVERIRHCRLTGQGEHSSLNTIHKSVSATGPALSSANYFYSGTRLALHYKSNPGRPFGVSGLSSRPVDMLVDSFMFWMDTVEMVRVAGHPLVFYSGWVFPIYIFCYLSCLRVVVMPQNPLLSSLRVALQDLPFFFVCVGLIAIFGFVTPILYLMKNLLVCLAFVYFNLMTKLKVFNTKRMLF